MSKFQPRNPEFESNIIERLKGQHFMHLMGFDLQSIKAGEIIGEMNLEQHHLQQFGYVHGGVTATILDITMGFAAFSLVPVGFGTVTANISVDYFHPGQGEKIMAIGKVEKAGKSMMFCTGEVYAINKNEKKLIATARSVMAVVDAKKH
ncbi:PaaI family thioesterase [Bacteroidia bacterium]|nr:PaaI family thioesterase [Bacteroidia bacterium]MDC1395129.1 PaaI family thioesterase [Bacteroidia bacterium]